ncbi:MAG: YeeE/YedE family protein [Rhizobiaceae bacterium]|nr:YeeE/YedE family protein [Rhizobiaceae bacterium]MCV0405379.1 YeeE/YedE family protein [Rhizobiaceae bacterium]
MDLVPLIDAVGEPGAALAGGAMLGLVFGVAAQRSAFCTRSAVLDIVRGGDGTALATWLVGFAVAILGVQLLLFNGALDVTETRFFSTAQSLSGAAVGGLMFGIGMILARGCVSRLLVLGASGNLRALFSILIVGLVGLATYAGILSPLRDAIGGLMGTGAIGGNDLLASAGLDRGAGLALGLALAVLAAGLALRNRLSPWRVLGGAAVGATIVGGWWFTWQLSMQVFEPIQAESLSFIRPLATSGEIAIGRDTLFGWDQGLLAGTVLGAFAAAILFRDFRIATFSEPGTPSILRYAIGAVLMGFGGILAVGCTIGAGFTGGSVLAISSILGLASMVAGAALAELALGGRPARKPGRAAAGPRFAQPAE